jgi:hypothetical protein
MSNSSDPNDKRLVPLMDPDELARFKRAKQDVQIGSTRRFGLFLVVVAVLLVAYFLRQLKVW